MQRLRFLTAGESHGKAVVAILEGMPAGVRVRPVDIDSDLVRRMAGYGRSDRMKIEQDAVQILSGIRHQRTIGSPVTLLIPNLDYPNWTDAMAPEDPSGKYRKKTVPYPGHADIAGALKYGFQDDLRSVTERASARETAGRVAVAAVAKRMLQELGIVVRSHVTAIGGERFVRYRIDDPRLFDRADTSDVRCGSPPAARRFRRRIDAAARASDSVGGVFEMVVFGLPPGLGSYVHWDRKLSTRLAAAVMSINAVKGVEIGEGFALAHSPGRKAQDPLYRGKGEKTLRRTNRAGGLEGGVTNGEPLIVRAAMKPISSAVDKMDSFDVVTDEAVKTDKGRSDVCAVPSASVVGEAMVALVLADAVLEKFGGDSLSEIRRNLRSYLRAVAARS